MLKVLILSMGPIFPNAVHGGSQKILTSIALYLGELGYQVKILCSGRQDLVHSFKLSENVSVEAILSFKQPFPNPFEVPVSRILSSLTDIRRSIDYSDVIYVHDGSFLPILDCPKRPIVASIRDYIYSESLVGLFSFRRDKLILNSKYSYDIASVTLGNTYDNVSSKLHLINNGICSTSFHPMHKDKARKKFEHMNNQRKYLAFPHRTVAEKGSSYLIRVMQELEYRGYKHLDVIMPLWMDSGTMIGDFKRLWNEKLIYSNLITLPWINQKNMKYLYNAVDVTLCLGNAAETFGSNVALESLACGTPVVAAAVGAYRTTIPSRFIHLTNYGLERETADCIEAALDGSKKPSSSDRQELIEIFSFDQMLDGYKELICNTEVSEPLEEKSCDYSLASLSLAPWCDLTDIGIYHDFERQYYPRDSLYNFLKRRPAIEFSITEASNAGVNIEQINRYIADGILTIK